MMTENSDFEGGYILGIDMGTTSIKIVIVDIVEKSAVYEHSQSMENAYIVRSNVFSEQSVQRMITHLDQCVMLIPPDLANEVIGIGVCGQLHGVVCWSSTHKPWKFNESTHSLFVDLARPITPYYNWQDNRCDSNFLESLPEPDSHLTIHTGYGCCTLFWLAKNSPTTLENMNRSSTIADFVVSALCELNTPKMSTHSAASWGYFETESSEWNKEILEANGFPIHLLPEIVQPDVLAGTLKHSWHGIRPGIPVGTALGDLQAYVCATLKNDNYAVCNISTSAQLVFIAKNFNPSSGEQKKTVAKIVPYFDGLYLYEGAVLNGGNAVELFVKNLHEFVSQFHPLDEEVNLDSIWARLIEEAAFSETDLEFHPTFLGERYSPHVRGSLTNVKIDNFSMPQIFRALCKGVITNIQNIVTVAALKERQITKIIGTGLALLRNNILQIELEKHYHPLPVEYTSIQVGDSAFGAASTVLKILMKERSKIM